MNKPEITPLSIPHHAWDGTFGDRVEEVASTLAKGDRVYVEGRIKLNTWNDATTGEKRSGLQVASTVVTALGKIGRRRPKSASRPSSRGSAAMADYARPSRTVPDQQPRAWSGPDAEIPF